RLVPEDLPDVAGHEWLKAHHHLIVGSIAWDQLPGVAEMSFEAEAAGDLVPKGKHFQGFDPAEVECSHFRVERGAADYVPTVAGKEQLVRAKFCLDLLPLG